jgi:S1-C subfamily serine protease
MDAPVPLVKYLLETVVSLQTTVPRDHPSASILGEERMGSGVVVDESGLILTVTYVVMGAQTVHVSFLKGRRLKGEVIAQDFETGLALVRIKRPGLRAVSLAPPTQGLERGTSVVAVGSTGPQERRVAGGLITYLGEFEAYWEYLLDRGIVSSAANPGYGGGGLFDLHGRLLGILYLNLNEVARSSLAIPVDAYQTHEDELVRFGRVRSRPRRAWLGIYAHALEEGVVIAGVVPGGPGEVAGLREGDLIMSFNAEEVGSRRDLYMRLWSHEPGERLHVEVMRDKKLCRFEVTGGDRAEFFRQR